MRSPSRSAQPSLPPGAPEKLGRRERRRAEIRERLYRSALVLFRTRGFCATTVQNITEEADVGKGTFYNYFQSKEHVFELFWRGTHQRLEETLQTVRDG